MLAIKSVSKRYKAGNFGVRHLNLEVENGVLGLLGPNGAGKTTLMQMISTVTKPTGGKISFGDIDVIRDPQNLRQCLGYLPQDFGTYGALSAREHLEYFAALKGVYDRSRIDEMLELVNLHTVAGRAVEGFSGGMRQRLGIAQALINQPRLVIVDEPTAGLDPEERLRFRNLLGDIGADRLVILSTHVVSDVESVASSIAVLNDGQLVVHDRPERLVAAAEGQVWELVAPSSEYQALRKRYAVSRATTRGGQVHLRVVGQLSDQASVTAVRPTLEDAYLWLISQQRQEVAAQ